MSVFKPLTTGDVIIGRVQTVSDGIFPAGTTEWSTFYTLASQTQQTGSSFLDPKSGLYYFDVYSKPPESNDDAENLFSVTYGSAAGTGSKDEDRTKWKIFPTKAIYSQYQNLILSPGDEKFSFQSGSANEAVALESDDIYVINFSTNKVKEQLDPGLFQFTLGGGYGSFTFVDDSPNEAAKKSVYNIVSGSLETTSEEAVVGNPIGLGLMYPQLGIIVLNPSRAAEVVGNNLTPADGGARSYAINHESLYDSIADGAVLRPMKGRSSEYIPSRQYFIRVRNNEFNYSNNPTFVYNNSETGDSSDNGKVRHPEFYNDPHVYITTVGLYDDNNELIAVAKLSQPLEKTFDSEALIKIKLDI